MWKKHIHTQEIPRICFYGFYRLCLVMVQPLKISIPHATDLCGIICNFANKTRPNTIGNEAHTDYIDMQPEKLIEKYYAQQPSLMALLLRHSRQVAEKSMEVLDMHPEIDADRTFVYEAAMLHDIGILHTNAPGIECMGTEPYVCHGRLGAEMLRREGFPTHARVAERHTGTGLTAETIRKQGLPLPLMDFLPETIEEQIVCYADKFFSKSHPEKAKTPEQVRQMLSRFHDSDLDCWDRWVELFG